MHLKKISFGKKKYYVKNWVTLNRTFVSIDLFYLNPVSDKNAVFFLKAL